MVRTEEEIDSGKECGIKEEVSSIVFVRKYVVEVGYGRMHVGGVVAVVS